MLYWGMYSVGTDSPGARRTGLITLEISEARTFANQQVQLTWIDRKGEELHEDVQVYGVEFLPLYGPCLITSAGEIKLDRVKTCTVQIGTIAA